MARRRELPRQRLNHHLRELELVRLVEERRRRGCTERILLATAHSFLLSPDLLGELGDLAPEELLGLDRYGWPPLAVLAGRTLGDLAVLRDEHGDEVAALSVPAWVRFSSPSALDGFLGELTREIDRVLW